MKLETSMILCSKGNTEQNSFCTIKTNHSHENNHLYHPLGHEDWLLLKVMCFEASMYFCPTVRNIKKTTVMDAVTYILYEYEINYMEKQI